MKRFEEKSVDARRKKRVFSTVDIARADDTNPVFAKQFERVDRFENHVQRLLDRFESFAKNV